MPVRKTGLSLIEILIGAVIIGVSAVPVLELVRSGTSQLEVSEIEAAPRQLGADVLERVAGPPLIHDKGLSEALLMLKEKPGRWEQVIQADPPLKKAMRISIK